MHDMCGGLEDIAGQLQRVSESCLLLVASCVAVAGSSVEDLVTVGHDGYTDAARYFFEQGGADRLLAAYPDGGPTRTATCAGGRDGVHPPGAYPAVTIRP